MLPNQPDPSASVGMTWQSVFLFDPDFHRGDIEMWFGSFELVAFGYCWSGRYTAIVTESLSSESTIPNPFQSGKGTSVEEDNFYQFRSVISGPVTNSQSEEVQ